MKTIELPSDLKLVEDVGDRAEHTACLMSAAGWLAGEIEHSDESPCVCPTIRHIAIQLNMGPWWADDAERTRVLMPLVPLLVGTATDDLGVLIGRANLAAERAWRVYAPLALETAATLLDESGVPDHPAILRKHAAALKLTTDASLAGSYTARDASVAARAARDASDASDASYASRAASYASRAASYASDAASDASVAARAARDASDARDASYASYASRAASYASYASYASRAASYASDAASDASDAASATSDAARLTIRDNLIDLVTAMCAITPGK